MGRKKKSRAGRPRFPRGTTKAAIHKKIMRERRKVKLRIRAERRQQKQEEKEERMYVRWLLFCKGRGKDKNLNEKDSLFINHHVHRAHDRYLLALQHGIDNRVRHHGKRYIIKRDPAHPPKFQTYRRIWYGGAKQNYIRCDVPKLMKTKWNQLQSENQTIDTFREVLRDGYERSNSENKGLPEELQRKEPRTPKCEKQEAVLRQS